MYNKKVLIDSLKKLGSAKAPTQKKDMIIDPRGQWAHPGKNTRIPSNNITMDNVPYPVYADPNVGPSRMMYPEQEYNFPGADYVDEYPQINSKKLIKKQLGGLTRFVGSWGRMMGLPPALSHISNIAPKVNVSSKIVPRLDQETRDLLRYPSFDALIGESELGSSPTELTKYLGDFDFKAFSDGWEARNQMMNAFDGPQWMPSRDDFFNDDELIKLVNQQSEWQKARNAFDDMEPENPGMFMFNALSGDRSREELFSNLFPNVSMPNFRSKFTTPNQESLLQQNLPWQYSVRNQGMLDPNRLKNINTIGDTLPQTYQDLLKSQKDNWFTIAPARDIVMEMRGSLGLKMENLQNATPEQFEKWRQEIVKKKNIQVRDRFNRDISNPFKGSDAWREISNQSGYKNKYGGSSNNNLSVKQSNIQGKGLFINKPIKKGETIGLAHVNGKATPMVGKYHNHSEDNSTAINVPKGNKRYLVASRDFPAGTEITTNYRLQPELEQPEDFMQKGGMTPQKDGYRTYSPFQHLPFIDVETDTIDTDNIVYDLQLMGDNGVTKNVQKNTGLHKIPGANVIREIPMGRKGGTAPRLPRNKNSKGYSRSLEATNKFFAKHAFFAKPKSRKNKIYDPNAKYYQDGGIPYSNLPATYQSALQNFVYPNVIDDPERTGYNSVNNTISYDSQSPIENMSTDWWKEHELFHDLQNQAGGMSTSGVVGQRPNPYVASDDALQGYYNRRESDINRTVDGMIAENPNLQFIPRDKLIEGSHPGFIGAEDLQYADPSTVEGEARQYEQYIREGNPSIFPKQQNGGELPEDYSQFQSFAQTLPSNLQDPNFEYGNPDHYNLYGMWETVGKPGSFSDVQDGEYFHLQDDGSYHGFTVGSDGEFLKPMSHGTTWKEVMNAHLNTDPYFQQNRIIKNEQGRLQYIPREEEEYIETELTPEEIEQYAKGGYIIEDISIPSLTKAQGGGPITGIVKGGNTLSKIISGEGNATNLLRLTNRAITPIGYGFAGKLMAAPLTFVAPYKPQTYNLKNRYDAWDIYNQMTPRYGGISANADGTAAIKDFEIAKDVLDKIRESKKTAFETVDFNDDILAGNSVNFGGVHGNGHATKGVDEDGRDYIDFTDTWDLQPFQRRGFLPQAVRNFEAGTLTGGKPFELRNRIYFDKDGQYFDHDGNPLTEYEREMPNMKYSAAAKKVQSNAASGDIKDVDAEWKRQKFLTTKNISQDEFNSIEDDWGSADNRAKLYQYGTLLGGLGLGAYGSYQYKQSTKPRLMFNTETGQYDLVTPAQIKTFPGRYVDTRPEQQYEGTLPKKQLGGLTKYAEFLPGITSFTPGNALRAAVYRGVNPASYNLKEKATGFPKEIFNTTFNNETRPFRVGMSLKYGTPDFMNTFFASKRITPQQYAKLPDSARMLLHDEGTREILQDIGRRRLDAWAVGLKQPQEYGTLEQVEDNTYRMKDISYTPDFFSERYADIQAQGVKDRGYSYGEENPLVTIARQHYDRTPHPFMRKDVSKNFMEQELLEKYQNAPRSYIDQALGFPQYEPDPWTQQRHAGISTINQDPSFKYSVWDNDGYGVMGGYRWDVAKNPEGMHWQANDVWDINPWERRGSAYINPGNVFKKLLHANYFKPLQNVEVLGALGGKPFNIQNNFLIDPVTFKPLKQWQNGGPSPIVEKPPKGPEDSALTTDLTEAQLGGAYELGDEVNETTMKKLKKLGYTFEKI